MPLISHALREGEERQRVPVHLQDAHYGGHESLGHGIGYKYAHDYPNHYVNSSICHQKSKENIFTSSVIWDMKRN